MASEGPNNPGTMADDAAVGTLAWSNPDNAKTSDDAYARRTNDFWIKDKYVKIVKSDASIGAENKGDTVNAWSSTEAYYSYGGAADLWSEAWTPADINDVDFGVVLSIYGGFGTESHYLKATNFGFTIPVGATINGILVEIERKALACGPECKEAYVDHIRITVYYTEVVGTNTQINIGDTWKEISEMQINIGDVWKDVAEVKQNIGDTWKTIF